MIALNYIITLLIMIIILLFTFILFEKLDYKFDIKIKYFSKVAINRFIYYIVFIVWATILFCMLLMNYIINNYLTFILAVLCFSLFLCLYGNIRNWKMANIVYIKNVNLLLKAKEKRKRKNKKR